MHLCVLTVETPPWNCGKISKTSRFTPRSTVSKSLVHLNSEFVAVRSGHLPLTVPLALCEKTHMVGYGGINSDSNVAKYS